MDASPRWRQECKLGVSCDLQPIALPCNAHRLGCTVICSFGSSSTRARKKCAWVPVFMLAVFRGSPAQLLPMHAIIDLVPGCTGAGIGRSGAPFQKCSTAAPHPKDEPIVFRTCPAALDKKKPKRICSAGAWLSSPLAMMRSLVTAGCQSHTSTADSFHPVCNGSDVVLWRQVGNH